MSRWTPSSPVSIRTTRSPHASIRPRAPRSPSRRIRSGKRARENITGWPSTPQIERGRAIGRAASHRLRQRTQGYRSGTRGISPRKTNAPRCVGGQGGDPRPQRRRHPLAPVRAGNEGQSGIGRHGCGLRARLHHHKDSRRPARRGRCGRWPAESCRRIQGRAQLSTAEPRSGSGREHKGIEWRVRVSLLLRLPYSLHRFHVRCV